MAEIKVMAAIGRGQLQEAFRRAEEQPLVVFGTLYGQAMNRIREAGVEAAGPETKVYLYETG